MDNGLKLDLSGIWLMAPSIEDILLMGKKGELVRSFFLEGALTAFGDHWDLLSCFAL